MKAVVLETKDGYCAVLKDDGSVEKVKMVGEVGQEIDMPVVPEKERRIRRFPLKYVATAASVALVAVSSGYLSFVQDYSFVSMDVDASVEYSLNRMDRVVQVNAVDKKGESLAKSVVKEGALGNTLDEAVNVTTDVLQRDGYVEKPEDVVLVSVSSKNQKKNAKLKKKVKDSFDKKENVVASVEDVTMDDRKAAQEMGLSVPRYAMVKSVVGIENLDEATVEVAKTKSTSELLSIAEEIDETLAAEEILDYEDALAVENVDPEVSDVVLEDNVEEVVDDIRDAADESDKNDKKEDVSEEDGEAVSEEITDSDTKPESDAEKQDAKSQEEGIAEETGTEDRAISPSTVPVDESHPGSFLDTSVEENKEQTINENDLLVPGESISNELGSAVEP